MPPPSFWRVSREVVGAFVGNLTDGQTGLSRKLSVLGGFTASGVRFAAGTSIGELGDRPEKPLVLWDFERCPYCRLVREALSALDLDAEVRPCPRGGTRFRPELEGQGVPMLEDPNTGERLRGSRTIVAYLYQRYGKTKPPGVWHAPPVTVSTGLLARAFTGGRGANARPSKAPARPLELASFESSPYCRLTRATLCELELPYTLRNLAKGSPRREAFFARAGKVQLPWLFDPNTGVAMFESQAIDRYLEATYGLAEAPALPKPPAT